MNDLQNLLHQIQRLDQEAEAGPWDHDREVNTENGWSLGTVRSHHTGESVAPEVYDADGAFIALARTALPQLAKAVQAVMELHKPFAWSFSAGDQVYTITSCEECARLGADEEDAIYPCPTVQAITDALGDDDAQ